MKDGVLVKASIAKSQRLYLYLALICCNPHLDLPVLLVTVYCSGLMPLNMWKNIWPTKMTAKSESIVMEKIVLAFMISCKESGISMYCNMYSLKIPHTKCNQYPCAGECIFYTQSKYLNL